LQSFVIFPGALVSLHPEISLSQETTGSTGRIVNGLTDLGGNELHHKAHHRSRRIELASQPVLVAQTAEQLFIHLGNGENVVLTVEINAVEPKGVATAVIGSIKIFVPIAGIVDISGEMARLEKELGRIARDLQQSSRKLANRDFMAKLRRRSSEKKRRR